MTRRTTLWEDLGIGVLVGATIVLTTAIWALIASERGVMPMNRIGPSTSELYVSGSKGSADRELVAAASPTSIEPAPPRR